MRKTRQGGFTIVEMMIAMSVFGVIMLVAAGTVVRFTNNFQKGVVSNTTQATARSIIDTIAQEIQFGGISPGALNQAADGTLGYCVGSTSYSYVLGRQLDDQVDYALVEQRGLPTGCGTSAQNLSTPSAVQGQEMLAPHMRIALFKVTNQGNFYTVHVKLVYGDDDLLCSTQFSGSCDSNNTMNFATLNQNQIAALQCKTNIGSQFCAVSELSTSVHRRL
jgi:prepilin-type N-terminal cleavage/methylation domain-containing protein